MPAIVVEDAALNLSSTVGLGLPAATTVFALPFPTTGSSTNESDDYWWRQSTTEDAAYYDTERSYLGFFDAEDDNFGSPLPFDDSPNGLWNGRFVPPPPRPPFLEDSIVADGITTCDLCSWARPTKSTFTFDGTIEKAAELGWPLAIIIVSVLSAIIGAILMITIVRYKRRKSSNRNETNAVQWWSRNKQRPHTQSIRRNNIYTGNPSDSIRGLHHNIHLNNHHRHHQCNHNNHNNNHPYRHHEHAAADTCNWPNVTSFVVNS